MKYNNKRRPSRNAVSSVASFVAGTHLYGKPRPSTMELMLELRKASRQVKNLSTMSATGKPPGAVASSFYEIWDTFLAGLMTAWFATLRIFLFVFFWGLLLMAVPAVIRHL